MLTDWPTASVADAQDSNRIAFNGEENTVHVRLASIEQVPHLKRKRSIFGRNWTASGETG